VAALALVFFQGACQPAKAAGLLVAHDLSIELVPSAHLLTGFDRMSIRVDDRHKLVFSLSERVTQIRVEVEGAPRTFRFSNSELEIPLEPDERRRTVEVVIAYEAVFNDPVPLHPLNTDNPGFGVIASISDAGTFLLAGAGWYPDLVDGQDSFLLKVKAPEGILAVTTGHSLGHATRDGKTYSEWRIDHPVRGLALSAAAYQLREMKAGDVTAATYFLPQNQDLAPAYLEATARYLSLYSDRFGPYPFPRFAVVENFVPTGFGFPSYTLLGSTVLRLPFILATSLGHEIAHCWWGNGVLVDFESGNWSEALTTYVSDYLYKEMESPAEARDYRLQALRSYAALVPSARDFPLARFVSRTDTVTKAVGYDKGVMVFHMLRRLIGEEHFWGALRDLYRERLFQPVSWEDLRHAFERRSGQSLGEFFDQWVRRKGAPRLRLEAVKFESASNQGSVTGQLVQEKPFFTAEIELALETRDGRMDQAIRISEASGRFEFTGVAAPQRMAVDPDHHLLRRLDPAEIPPTVNSLKSSPSTLLVICARASGSGRRLADTIQRSLGLRHSTIVEEDDLGPGRLDDRDVILVGLPRDRGLLRASPAGLQLDERGFSLDGSTTPADADTFFGVLAHPSDPLRVLAVFLPGPPSAAESAAAKITHYGRYSYVTFKDGQNRDKGSWAVTHSPVIHRWD
jgi:aminopeptidase N